MERRWLFGIGLVLVGPVFAPAFVGCAAVAPKNRVLADCEDRCRRDAAAVCTESDCMRGCRFSLDRLVEREGPKVVACVAAQKTAEKGCGDRVFAECAAKVGPYANGGPPAPPAFADPDDDGDDP